MDKPKENTTPQPAEVKPEISKALSQVANINTRSVRLVIGIVATIALAIFLSFSGTDKKSDKLSQTAVVQPNVIVRPQQDLVDLPPIPKAPPLSAPKVSPKASVPEAAPAPEPIVSAPLPPPAVVVAPKIDMPLADVKELNKDARVQSRHRSNIMLINSSAASSPTATQEIEEIVVQKREGNGNILPKGKIIDAILETSLDTAIGGDVKAVVSYDVYDTKGRTILIPRGSVVFGTYNSAIESTYDRINITWKRIDLPSGYLINFDGTAVDGDGRKGIAGRYDGRYKEQLMQLAAASALNIGAGVALDNIVPQSLSTQQQNINNASISNIRSKTFAAFNNQNYSADQKIAEICSIVRSEIVDKTSTSYKNFDNACAALTLNSTADANQKLISLMTSVSTAVDQLSQSTIQASATTKTQDATNQAFSNAQSTIKNMINQSRLVPVVTVDKGQKIRILVNKDYRFPHNIIEQFIVIK